MITPTVQQFLTQTDLPGTDEPDDEPAQQLDPLASIAESLRTLTEVVVRRDGQDAAEDESKQALDQLDAEYAELGKLHDAKQQLIDDTLAICSKSVSKLANEIRALLEPVVTAEEPEVPQSDPEQPELPLTEPEIKVPAHDAPVEEWRDYARHFGVDPADVDKLNRSQIRTLLGMPHGGEES